MGSLPSRWESSRFRGSAAPRRSQRCPRQLEVTGPKQEGRDQEVAPPSAPGPILSPCTSGWAVHCSPPGNLKQPLPLPSARSQQTWGKSQEFVFLRSVSIYSDGQHGLGPCGPGDLRKRKTVTSRRCASSEFPLRPSARSLVPWEGRQQLRGVGSGGIT